LASVRIHYLRPPDRETVYVQHLVHRAPDVVVTYVERTPLARPLVVDGEVALEPDAPAVWFTFPGAWFDLGRFHRRDGSFTGFYANVITPVEFIADDAWRTTDLFLDVWKGVRGEPRLLDEDELEEAIRNGWIGGELEERARAEAARLLEAAARPTWPPPSVLEWTLERCRRVLRAGRDG
jgi:predicted RNA-binding protein associated with RNAse of E/G family